MLPHNAPAQSAAMDSVASCYQLVERTSGGLKGAAQPWRRRRRPNCQLQFSLGAKQVNGFGMCQFIEQDLEIAVA